VEHDGVIQIRPAAAEVKIHALIARLAERDRVISALTRELSERSPGADHPRPLLWPPAAAVTPASPKSLVATPRTPSPALDPLNDYVGPARAATASPEPDEAWSEQDESPFEQGDFDGVTPPGSPPS
jgi:hypothetical protein